MKIVNYLPILSLLLVGFYSCDDEVTVDDFSQNEVDFSNFIAIGNSLTAGYADGALYMSAQQNSYPALIAQQISMAGSEVSFSQPMVNDDLGGLLLAGNQIAENRLELVLTQSGFSPSRVQGNPTTDITQSIASSGPYNNLAVPGAKSFHLLSPTYGDLSGVAGGTANPYYVRFSQANQSVLQAAIAQNPTFFTLWIGNNDVLGYATSGGAMDQITDVNTLTGSIDALLQGLTSTGAQGVVANIPNVTDIPYFTTVPNQPIPLDQANADALNTAYASYNTGLDQLVVASVLSAEEADLRKINFVAGNNAPVTLDPTLTDLTGINPALLSMRQVKPGELHTLPAASVVGTLADPNNPASVIGLGVPLDHQYVLSLQELEAITTATADYNSAIATLSAQYNVPMVDMNSFFQSVANTGLVWNGADYSVDFVSGGLFSLDGVHPTQKGYALIANHFIEAMNQSYDVSIPILDINNYPGVAFP